MIGFSGGDGSPEGFGFGEGILHEEGGGGGRRLVVVGLRRRRRTGEGSS